jgi:outer membrane receptor protein involved in Fe transport
MKLSVQGHFRRVIHLAFAVGISGVGLGAQVHAADQPVTQLKGVEVTGSRIRRVDTETSNLVQTLDRKQIEATGAVTLGQLIQSIPSITGTPLTPSANNNGVSTTGGGGTFEASSGIDIRGLGPKRTLVLLDGQRLNNGDPDAIPANMIERVEVLKEGAGSVYGSDAIGGVVNFITRKHFKGLEITGEYAKTQRGDADTRSGSVTWGSVSAKGSVVFGLNYNNQKGIWAGSREVTSGPVGLAYGQVLPMAFSSSRSPGGLFSVGNGCSDGVTLIQGTNGTSAADFRCYVSNFGAGPTDRYNYQPVNYDLDPTKHMSLFGTGSYDLTDEIRWYGQGYFTHAQSQAHQAAEPFDAATIQALYPDSTPTISAQSIYNPFGVDITNFAKRAIDAGPRIHDSYADQFQVATGFKGTLLERFDWNLALNYGRLAVEALNHGYLDFTSVLDQIGPSFWADPSTGAAVAAGTPGAVATCGTPQHPLLNCTPLDVMGTTGNTLANIAVRTNDVTVQDEKDVTFDVNGDLFELPAGPLGAAAGFEYRRLTYTFTPDALEAQFHASEANQKPTAGAYDDRDLYAELHVPVVRDLPGAKSFNINLGVRYSNFSSFGSNTSGKYAFEYRPYGDLMLRGTYADVFRAPGTTELYGGAAQSAAGYSDPCVGLSAAQLAQHSKACQGVLPNATQPNTQGNANTVGNPDLKPETGYALDWGLVFNPSFYKPFSATIDFWRYSLKNGITNVTLQQILDACYADDNSAFCGTAPSGLPYFQRSNYPAATPGGSPTTTIATAEQPLLNSFAFWVSGWDYSVKLNYPGVKFNDVPLGNFEISLDVTYQDRFDLQTFDPGSGAPSTLYSDAGLFDQSTLLSIPRFKGLGYLFWSMGSYGFSIEDRYVGNLRVLEADLGTGASRNTGYANYIDVAGTYNYKPLNVAFTVGITDLFDDGAQRTYDYSYAGAQSPVYDIRGRNFYGRVTMRFK